MWESFKTYGQQTTDEYIITVVTVWRRQTIAWDIARHKDIIKKLSRVRDNSMVWGVTRADLPWINEWLERLLYIAKHKLPYHVPT